MRPFRTHYQNLKVSEDAPPEVIRMAYKALVKKFHPDQNRSPQAHQWMQIINASYEVLTDEHKRRQHDIWIESQLSKIRSVQSDQNTTSIPTNARSSSPHQTCNKPASSNYRLPVLALAILTLVAITVITVVANLFSSSPSSAIADADSPAALTERLESASTSLEQMPPPTAATFLKPGYKFAAPFAVETTKGNNYFGKLTDSSGDTVLAFFIRGGDTLEMKAPVGSYTLKFASGVKWYGFEKLFGPDTRYQVAEDDFAFRLKFPLSTDLLSISNYSDGELEKLEEEIRNNDIAFRSLLEHHGLNPTTCAHIFDRIDIQSGQTGADLLDYSWWKDNIFAKFDADHEIHKSTKNYLEYRNFVLGKRLDFEGAGTYEGYTVTLYNVPNGNLGTKAISEVNF